MALTSIAEEAKHMAHTIDQLLVLARADAGVEGMNLEDLDLNVPVWEAAEYMVMLSLDRGLEIDRRLGEPVIVKGDQRLLRQLLLNLAGNAVRYTPGGPHIHVTMPSKATEAGNPDFRLWNGRDRIIGYNPAKKPTEEYLERIEGSEQLRRYRASFANLILTNFLEFRLYDMASGYRRSSPGGQWCNTDCG